MALPRIEWPPGEWGGEPDAHEWVYCTYPCRIRRGPFGAWCGYVMLPDGHPWLAEGRHIEYEVLVSEVHGGISYKNGSEIGFDCSHAGDLCPGIKEYETRTRPEAYRNMKYAIEHCERLVREAVAAEFAQA